METKPYLIALDLDGTLLKDDKTISPETARMKSNRRLTVSRVQMKRTVSPHF